MQARVEIGVKLLRTEREGRGRDFLKSCDHPRRAGVPPQRGRNKALCANGYSFRQLLEADETNVRGWMFQATFNEQQPQIIPCVLAARAAYRVSEEFSVAGDVE